MALFQQCLKTINCMGKLLAHHLNPKCIEPVHEKLNKPSFAYIAKLEEIIEVKPSAYYQLPYGGKLWQ